METRAAAQHAGESAAFFQLTDLQPGVQWRYVAIVSRTIESEASALSRSRGRCGGDSRAAGLSTTPAGSRIAGPARSRDLCLQGEWALGSDRAFTRLRAARPQTGLSLGARSGLELLRSVC